MEEGRREVVGMTSKLREVETLASEWQSKAAAAADEVLTWRMEV